MHKARKEIAQRLKCVDLVIELLDARIPFSSANPMLAELRAGKPCIKVLNKIDLADDSASAAWQQHLQQCDAVNVVGLCSKHPDIKGLARRRLGLKDDAVKFLL